MIIYRHAVRQNQSGPSARCCSAVAAKDSLARRDLREQLVRCAFFVEGLAEKAFGLGLVEFAGKRPCCGVGGDLVVLDPLGLGGFAASLATGSPGWARISSPSATSPFIPLLSNAQW